ncbi:TonB-dependent siderophore receptor [Sphingomonas sp. LT1P40]|uniref:TonB-dependent siderophore receptor n=1 Tax=Alteristakelama amylovorans TaxID=3096166 RepID=UPI002FC58B50
MRMKSATGLRLALLAACCVAALPGSAVAQDADEDASGEDVTVTGSRAQTGTKTDTPLIEIPQSISVITAQEFQDRSVVDFQDIYRYSAGVAAPGSVDSRGDFVITRGFAAAQYVDGLKRMPDFIYGARLEAFTLERAEVLRGPSSVLYGAGGPGGVLNGVSKMPQFTFGGQVGVLGGTDDRIQGQLDVTGPLSDNVAARFVGLVRDGKTQWGTPDDRWLINPSIRLQAGEATDITLIGLWQKDKQGSLGYSPLYKSFLAPAGVRKVDFNFYQGEPGFNGMDTEYLSAALILSHKFTENVAFRSATRFSHMDTDYKEVYLNYLANPWADAAETMHKREFYVNYEKSNVFNTDNNLTFDFNTGPIEHKVLLGIDYTRFNQTKSEGFSYDNIIFPPGLPFGSPPPINIYNPQPTAPFAFGAFNFLDYKSTQLGVYLQDQISFADRVHVVLGVRRDRATSQRNGVNEEPNVAWSFRGGISAEVVDGVSPYFSYAESFLPVPGGDFFGNPFVPQLGRQFEGGVKIQPFSGALFTASYFDIVESNYVSQDPVNIQNFLQGGSIQSKGFEAELVIRVPDNYEFTASYSYIDAKGKEASTTLAAGNRVPGQPRHIASAWGSKTFLFGNDWKLRAGVGVRYIGDRIDSSQTLLNPDVTLVDAMLSLSKGLWTLSVNGSNILNKQYYDLCSSLGPTNGSCVAAKDRNIMAGITRRF